MEDLLERSARFIDEGRHEGMASINPMSGELAEIGEDLALVQAFSHVVAFDSGDGLVLFDTSLAGYGPAVVAGLHRWRRERVHTIVYTHGHVDHVGGTGALLADAEARGHPRPALAGHEAIGERFARYELTLGYNRLINERQFGSALGEGFAVPAHPPEITYRDHLALSVGDLEVRLHHDLGETDDHTWAWLPQRRTLVVGDFFIWFYPNAGNPQKAQRYPLEWAETLRRMSGLGAELLLPAHGLPIAGEDRIRTVLEDVAAALETIVEQTLRLMNEGMDLDTIVHTVELPTELLGRPYLNPHYDEPEFVIRNVWRRYGGWFDGNPARLKPPHPSSAAAEVVALAGGVEVVAGRAEQLAEEGDLRLACHLIELAVQAEPTDQRAHGARADIYARRRDHEVSLMARGIYGWASRTSRAASEDA